MWSNRIEYCVSRMIQLLPPSAKDVPYRSNAELVLNGGRDSDMDPETYWNCWDSWMLVIDQTFGCILYYEALGMLLSFVRDVIYGIKENAKYIYVFVIF